MTSPVTSGLAAGAAGITALNLVSYLDMAVRGRPASSAPEQVVEAIAERLGVEIPGEGEVRQARLSALGALAGIGAGVAVGLGAAVARRVACRPNTVAGALGAGLAAMAAADVPMAALGVSDPRTWRLQDWISDVVPHVAYGAVVEYVLDRRT
ncbi:hypothetical protein [Skermania sp. ID1734]|uniref:hypothetical protein n=1 Tax=Skermania sp. ID1734 TaxID=2597516 RepID=UPI001C8F97FE|nr:hypothetical protein [Skermania sp. ID1734]